MTALERYLCLEALGVWRESSGEPPRDVIVSLGRTTLLLKDAEGRPLGHWALAGIVRLGQDGDAVIYAMAADADETLAVRDGDMIAAIAALARPGQASGAAMTRRKRRFPAAALLAAAAISAITVAAPRLFRAEAALLVRPERASELGDRLVLLIGRGGAPCADPGAERAIAAIAARLAPEAPPRVRLLALEAAPATHLPGGTLVLDPGLVATASPETIAGWVATALASDPFATLLAAVGPAAGLRYLLGGDLDRRALERAVAAFDRPPDPAAAGAVLDPLPGRPLLDANAQVALRHACGTPTGEFQARAPG